MRAVRLRGPARRRCWFLKKIGHIVWQIRQLQAVEKSPTSYSLADVRRPRERSRQRLCEGSRALVAILGLHRRLLPAVRYR